MSEEGRAAPPDHVPFGEAVRVWTKIGLLSFGGPVGQVALMHAELVERRRWIDEERFLHALSYCTLLPGPEAQQLAIYIGWLMHRTKGGLVAGSLFVLPGFVAMLALSVLYATLGHVALVAALFFGLKAAVLAIIVAAARRIGGRALRNAPQRVVAGAAFVALFFFDAPFPAVILTAGVIGLLGARLAPGAFLPSERAPDVVRDDSVVARMSARRELAHTLPNRRRAFAVIAAYAALWAAPGLVLALVLGPRSIFVEEAAFFSKAAVVTFGGAYAVLAYVAQRAVGEYAWLRPGEMLDGLGLAETTPGPLIMVVQFVGFLAAFRHPGGLSPLVAGVLGSVVTVWATFVPCFFWVFLGAPYVESLRGNRSLQGALSGITAAVVGVIASLSVWFALHVVFHHVDERWLGPARLLVPDWRSIDIAAAVLAVAATVALVRFRWSTLRTLAACAVLGAAWRLLR